MPDDPVIVLLRDLVAIDSVNPSLVAGARGEAQIAKRIAAELIDIGLEVHVSEVAPGRPNVVGVLHGRHEGPHLLYCGHMDTVGVAGMHRPFEPEDRSGRLYGRGTQDMKGGVAAMIGAARRIVERGGLHRGTLIVAAVIDEEHASAGADALVRHWRADAAVVTEPTGLDIAVAHKGFQWVSIEIRGRAAHGSRPLEGRDAILRMGRMLARLEALDRRLQAGPAHPLLGAASLHASTIEGGAELSSYPAQCVLQMERRTLPGEAPDVALREVRDALEALRTDDPEFEGDAHLLFGRHAYELDAASRLPDLLGAAADEVGWLPRRVGMTFWTDAAILGAAGIPSLVFGPGGGGLHTPDEYVLIEDVCRCRDALAAFALTYCGRVGLRDVPTRDDRVGGPGAITRRGVPG
jgi:acetylornithine deacetylase